MKKLFLLLFALIFAVTALSGCGPKAENEGGAEAAETAIPTEAAPGVTLKTALEGVKCYCRLTYGGQEQDAFADPVPGEETAEEYQTVFRSYTGTIVYFYTDKTTGATRIVEYVPMLDIESEAGSFDLFEYLGREADPKPTEAPAEPESRFVFQPKVCSSFMRDVFGDVMCDTWFELVDAVMAGEDTFACPDQDTYDWVMGQFPKLCFPILDELIDYAYDREHSVKDGKASFTRLVPPEEAAARIDEFAKQIEDILNKTMRTDYSDLEKALALYVYFSDTYYYDWDTYEKTYETYVDYTSTYRFFKTGMGICGEIAPAYSYLLMQAGVDATDMMGGDHEWSFVRINGRYYHIDPTFVISDRGSLAYFMMTDEQRGENGYSKDLYKIVSHYSEDHPHSDYTADDDTFSPIWSCSFDKFLPDEDKLICLKLAEGQEPDYIEFDYKGF